jgi:hypothetical protein
VTVKAVEPCTAPEAAVIVVVPGDTPVARPVPLFIVATLFSLLAHVKVSPLRVSPALSSPVAVNCWVAFTVIEGKAGLTVIVASGPGVTVKVTALLVTPPDVAVI